jgi:hypothetical protein
MSDLFGQAVKSVNEYAEMADGNWQEISRLVVEDLETLWEYAALDYAHALRHAFNSLRPDDVEPLVHSDSSQSI